MYNSANILTKGIRTDFFINLAKVAEAYVSAYTNMVSSEGAYEDYDFLGAMPGIREWIDQIDYADFEDYKLTIRNKPWQFGIRVDRDTLSDAKSTLGGSLELQIQEAAKQWKSFPNKLVSNLLANGKTGLCFDGTAFFANTHTFAAFDNLYSGTGITLAQIEADMLGAGTDLMGFKDKNGELFNDGAKLVAVIPTALRDKFATLRNSQETYITGSQTNILYNTFDIVIDARLTGNDWYLINVDATVKPFIYQSRQEPDWTFEDLPSRPYVNYISTARMNAGYGNPASIIMIDNS